MSSTVDQTPDMKKDSDASTPLESLRFSCLLNKLVTPIKMISFRPDINSVNDSQGEINNQLQNIYLRLKQRHKSISLTPTSPDKRYSFSSPIKKHFESPLKPNCISDSKAVILKTSESQIKLMECVNKRKTAFIVDEIQKRIRNRSLYTNSTAKHLKNVKSKVIDFKPVTSKALTTYETRNILGVSNSCHQPKTSNISTQVDFQEYLSGNTHKFNDTFGSLSKKPARTRSSSNLSNYVKESTALGCTLSSISAQVKPKLKPDELYSLLNSDISQISINKSCTVNSSKLSHLILNEKKNIPHGISINQCKQNLIMICSNFKPLSPYKKEMGFSSVSTSKTS